MTLHQLKIFEAIARHLNITKAAREIHISQPSVSKQLRLLQEEHGVKFHTRIGQGIKLTEEGQQFLNAVRPILQQLESIKKHFRAGESKGQFVVGATYSVAVSLLPELLRAYSKICPGIHATVRSADSATVEQMILNSVLEIGLITHPSYHPRLAVERFRPEAAVAVVSARHPLARKGILTLEELFKAPLILKLGGRIAKKLESRGYKLNIVLQCESLESARAAVETGLGIGLFYRGTVELGLKAGYLKAVKVPWLKDLKFQSFIVYPKENPLSRNAQDLLALLHKRHQ